MYYAGIDIGGTRIKMGVVDETGKIYVLENVETPSEKDALMEQVALFIQNCGYSIEGVGISTPGIVCDDGFMQTSGAIKCFFHLNMKEEFEQYLHLPVHVENDGKCAASAEKWLGAGRNYSDFAVMTLGTAIGGAIYIHDELYRGYGGMAGEFGIALAGFKKEDYSAQSMAYQAATVAGLCRNYSYAVHERVLDAREIIARSQNGDETATRCLDEFCHAVAVLCVNLAVTFAPAYVLIGGGISASELVMNDIQKAYEAICKNYHVLSLLQMPAIKTCELKNDAGLLGAVYCLMKKQEALSCEREI